MIVGGLASAVRLTFNGSPSVPTTSNDGGGWNLGESTQTEFKLYIRL